MRLQAISVIAVRIAQLQMELGTMFVAIAQRLSALNFRVLNLSPLMNPSPLHYLPRHLMDHPTSTVVGDVNERWFGPQRTNGFDEMRGSDYLSRPSHRRPSLNFSAIPPTGTR